MIRYLILLVLLVMLAAPVFAQVKPDAIPSDLITKSVRAELDYTGPIEWRPVVIGSAQKEAIQKDLRIKQSIPDTLYLGITTDSPKKHYLIPDIAPSRSDEFSFILFVDASKKILGVDVLQYRENYGNEIDYPFFRKQFKGKESAKKIIFGRTIQNISGATISARSITYSVHDLMLILNQISLP